MFYYKTETENGIQWESRAQKIKKLPDNMTEITETEYNAVMEEMRIQAEEEQAEEANKPENPYAAITTEEANEAIKNGVNAI